MLKKLLKHDFLRTYRFYCLIYCIILGSMIIYPLTLLPSVTGSGENILLTVFGFLTIFSVIITIAALIFVNVARFFYTSFYKKEGYLTFTLPASAKKIVISKIITISVWFIGLVIVTTLGGVIMIAELKAVFKQSADFAMIIDSFNLFLSLIGDAVIEAGFSALYITYPIVLILQLFWFIILVLLSGAIVNSKIIKKSGTGYVILVYLLLSFSISMIYRIFSSSISGLVNDNPVTLSIFDIIFYGGLSVGGFFLSTYLMEYKLELE